MASQGVMSPASGMEIRPMGRVFRFDLAWPIAVALPGWAQLAASVGLAVKGVG
jgi:hypothetical protein